MRQVIPDKPRSRNQKYRLTELGQMVLERITSKR
ncbi:Fic family protein [Phaeodactylibacter luteus]